MAAGFGGASAGGGASGSGGGGLPSWLTPAILGASALGGLFNGLSSNSASKAAGREQRYEFNIGNAPNVARAAQSAPLRDRLLQIMSQRFGANPTTYTQEQAGYAPSPDLANQEELYKKMMTQMGYGAPATGAAASPRPAAAPGSMGSFAGLTPPGYHRDPYGMLVRDA